MQLVPILEESEGVDSDEWEVQFLQAIEMREPVDEGVLAGPRHR